MAEDNSTKLSGGVVTKVKFALGMLAAVGGVGAAASAHATTITYNYSGLSDPQDVNILGDTEYTYGTDVNSMKLELSPLGTAMTGTESFIYSSPESDTAYSHTDVEPYVAYIVGEDYVNLKFAVDGQTYFGTADIVDINGDATLTSITYEPAVSAVSAAPEPAAWLLMVAGVGLSGAALRRRQRQFPAMA